MKNVSKLLTICVVVWFVWLYALEYTQQWPTTSPTWWTLGGQEHNVAKHVWTLRSGKLTAAEIAMDDLLQEKEWNDLALALLKKTWNTDKTPVHEVYEELIDGYAERKTQQVYIDALLPQDAWRERILSFSVADAETGEVIPGAAVYLWWAFVGYTADDGVLTVSKNIPRSHELLSFEVYKRWYSRGFQTFNGAHFKWKENRFSFTLNKSLVNIVKTTTQDFNIEEEEFELQLDESCSLVDAAWECYEGEVEVEYTFVAPGEVNTATIPMQAFYNGEVVNLTSNGMAFTDFFNDQGQPLQYNAKDWKVCYNLPKERIDMWRDKVQAWSSNGYRWFNRATGYWEKDETATITITDGQFCVTTKKIY